MPITVACVCGKRFRVRDEMAGQAVQCKVCDGEVQVPVVEEVPPPAAADIAPPLAKAECPECAEAIPPDAHLCPYCGTSLKRAVPPATTKALIQELRDSTNSYIGTADQEADARRYRYSLFRPANIILAILLALGLVLFGAGFSFSRTEDGIGLIIAGLILAICFGAALISVLSRNAKANKIQQADYAIEAFTRWFNAIHTKRYEPAFLAVAPCGRNREIVELPDVNASEITATECVTDLKSFKKHWKDLLGNSKGVQRQTKLSHVKQGRTIDPKGDLVEVCGTLKYTTAPSWIAAFLILILIALPLAILVYLIVYLATRRIEEVAFSKILIRQDGQWFIAEAGFRGPIDLLAQIE